MITVLIADKHSVVRLGVKQIIRNLLKDNCSIDFACSGREIMKKAGERVYDVIVTELNMPDIKGTSLITKTLSICSKARIVVFTTNDERHFAERCFQAGARAFIHKTASIRELETTIHTIIRVPFYISDKQREMFATLPPLTCITQSQYS